MPFNDCFWLHDNQGGLPIRSYLREPSPKQFVLTLELGAFDGPLLNNQLLAQRQILQDQIASADKEATN